jgi:hypothetical protein
MAIEARMPKIPIITINCNKVNPAPPFRVNRELPMVSSLFKYYFIPHLIAWRINYIFLDVKISYSYILPSIVYIANNDYQRMKHPDPSKIPLYGEKPGFAIPPKSPSIPLYKRGKR